MRSVGGPPLDWGQCWTDAEVTAPDSQIRSSCEGCRYTRYSLFEKISLQPCSARGHCRGEWQCTVYVLKQCCTANFSHSKLVITEDLGQHWWSAQAWKHHTDEASVLTEHRSPDLYPVNDPVSRWLRRECQRAIVISVYLLPISWELRHAIQQQRRALSQQLIDRSIS